MLRKLLITDEDREYLSEKDIEVVYRIRITKHIFCIVITIVMGMDLGLRLA